ncbi:MAG: FAD-dependent oxidoreductase, partial [Elusimicrobiota bacterium]
FEEYYLRARKNGINYIRCRPPSVEEVPQTKNLIIKYVAEDEKKASREYDLVVLSAGLRPPRHSGELAAKFGLVLNKHGFCANSVFAPVDSPKPGIFTAGAFTGPKDIPETVIQASSAAARALELLSEAKGSRISKKEYPLETDISGQEPRVGIFICHCGTNIAGVVNVEEVAEYAKKLPNVVYADNILYACANDSQEKIKKTIIGQKLNRVIVAACTPRTHESLFRNTIREAGLNSYLFEMANIRDQCSWVHMHEPGKATKKAKDLVRMALSKARLIEPLYRKNVPISKGVVVLGGGLAGMTAALSLANQGFDVHLIEKQAALGGNLRKLHYLSDVSSKPQQYLETITERVSRNKKIHIHVNAKIPVIEGFIGNFTTKLSDNGESGGEIKHGAIVVATGAGEHKPGEYLYGKNPNVLTQLELEERLANDGRSFLSAVGRAPKTVVMIQCVGSRETARPYCSRLCCNQAVKNALKIKELSPETNVYILYRDMRTYGFGEGYYTQARQEGVVFIRYDENKKPELAEHSGNLLSIKCFEPILRMDIVLNADLAVLSAAVVPQPENKELAQMLKVPLDANGFFLEAHMKLRPVDFANDGIFLCGMAHFPKAIDETIAQANAAAARVAAILSNDTMELDANISSVIDENCDGCAYCVDPCPYKAVTLIEYMKNGAIKKTVEVNSSLCKGCGVCQGTCPKKAVVVKGFKLEQLSAMVDGLLKE